MSDRWQSSWQVLTAITVNTCSTRVRSPAFISELEHACHKSVAKAQNSSCKTMLAPFFLLLSQVLRWVEEPKRNAIGTKFSSSSPGMRPPWLSVSCQQSQKRPQPPGRPSSVRMLMLDTSTMAETAWAMTSPMRSWRRRSSTCCSCQWRHFWGASLRWNYFALRCWGFFASGRSVVVILPVCLANSNWGLTFESLTFSVTTGAYHWSSTERQSDTTWHCLKLTIPEHFMSKQEIKKQPVLT